jgi:Tfp pilus assembly ATPase PilU
MRNADSKNELRLRIKLESKRGKPAEEKDLLTIQDEEEDRKRLRL